jgi:hypothetical protein
MDEIFYEKLLYRILQGRLRIRLGDLVLYIYEPSKDLIEESFDVYDDAYHKAYFGGVPIKSELMQTLIDNNLWSPLDDREADKLEKEIEELKVDAYKNFYDKRYLNTIKINIARINKSYIKCKTKKMALDHTSCEGVANFSRCLWLISKTTFTQDKNLYDWSEYTLSSVMETYNEEQITSAQFRKIARTDPWRSMWNTGKKQSNLFGRPSFELTKDQLSLSSFSTLYDNVYESHDCPHDKVIEDDDCLDGWLITQKRESDKNRTQKEVDALTKNSKIANSQEVFVMARNEEAAQEIYNLNNPMARNVIKQRNEQIKNEGNVKFTELADVKQDIAIQSHQQAFSNIKGKVR